MFPTIYQVLAPMCELWQWTQLSSTSGRVWPQTHDAFRSTEPASDGSLSGVPSARTEQTHTPFYDSEARAWLRFLVS